MLEMNIGAKKSSINCLEKIKARTFLEDDIKMLLISLRDYLDHDSILREVANFVAHPDRNQGISHRKINSRYLKLELVRDQIAKLEDDPRLKSSLDSEEKLSTYLLDSIHIWKIEKRLFKVLFVDGLEDIEEELLKKHYRMTKNKIKKLLENSFRKRDGYYHLKQQANHAQIDDITRFIRGTVQFSCLFSQEEIKDSFVKSLIKLNGRDGEVTFYLPFIENYFDEIFVCIIGMLHGATFKMDNGVSCHCFLSAYKELDSAVKGNGNLALMVKMDKHVAPVMVSEMKIDRLLKNEDKEIRYFKELAHINLRRDSSNELFLSRK